MNCCLLFVLAATAAGTTATVGKFSVPFFVRYVQTARAGEARCVQTAPAVI